MPTLAPIAQIVNQATQRSLDLSDSTPWYRGSRRLSENKAPPRYVWFNKSDGGFSHGAKVLAPGDHFFRPENRWFARERIELYCWGADYDDAWIRKSNAINYLDWVMQNGGGSWRIQSADYMEIDKAKNVDRGEVIRLVVEFDIPQNQAIATDVAVTHINLLGDVDYPDATEVQAVTTTV